MTTFDIALFDLDGTLTDPSVGITRSLVHALAAVGRTVDRPESLRHLIGPPLVESFAAMGLAPEQIEFAVTSYRERFATTGIFENALVDGIDALLADLSAAGMRLGVATSKPEPFAHTILDHFGLSGHFEVVAGATFDHARRHKGDVIAHALDQLGGPDVESVVMIGDREHDVFGAAEHGVAAVAVLWGYGSRAELEAAGPLAVVAATDELRDLLLAARLEHGPRPSGTTGGG